MLSLKTSEDLTNLVNDLVLTSKERLDLNRRLANRARQFFRQQIRAQRDVNNVPYEPRRTRIRHESWNVKNIERRVANKNMLSGLSRGLRTKVDSNGFAVGLSGVLGRIGKTHNEGKRISITTRVNSTFNSKTGLWTGGTPKKIGAYDMPKRTFLEWNDALESELFAIIGETIINKETN